MNTSTCNYMGTHAAVSCPKNKLHPAVRFKASIHSAVVFFVFALFFSGSIQAQDMKNQVKPVTIPKAVATITDNAAAAPLSATTCIACDGKLLNANKPVYKLVDSLEMAGKNLKPKTKSVAVPAIRRN